MATFLLNEGGSGGHMFHPFNLPSINTGRDLLEFFYKAAEFISRNPEQVIPSDSTSLKVDGANTAFKLVRGPTGLEFAFDRGSMKPIDVEGITIDRLTERWSQDHGMVAMGRIQLGALNRALPKIKNELITLGFLDNKGNPDSTKFINAEFCWKETNAVKYEEDFVALHGINQYYEKDYKGIHRPGAIRPLEKDEKTGKMIPTKSKSTEVQYDESAMESLREKVLPFFREAVGPKNPEGFNVYTVIPVSLKGGEDLVSKINAKLEEELSIQIKEAQITEWNVNESNGIATLPLKSWLSDSRTVNPRGHFIQVKEGGKKGAMSKEIYGRVLSGIPVESIVADPEGWDVAMAINGALFYYAIENVGATILKALTSPLGDMVTDKMAHEGIVLRNEELFGVKMVKITGNFITTGSGGKFAQDRGSEEQLPLSPVEKSEEPEQGDIEGEESDAQARELDEGRPYRVALVPGAFKPPHKGHLYMVERLAKIHGIDKVLVIISRPLKEQRALPSGKIITGEESKLIWEQFIAGSDIEKAEIHLSAAASPVQVVYDFVMKDPDSNNDLVAPEGSEVYMGCGDKEDDPKRFDDIIRKSREDIAVKVVTCPLDVKHSAEYASILDSSPDIKKTMPSVGDSKKDSNELHASDMRFVLELATKNLAGLEMLKDFVPNGDALAVMGILGLNPIDDLPEELSPEENFEEKGAGENLTEIFNRCISEVIREEFQTKMKKRLSRAHSFYLDQGRHDLTKFGAPFSEARPRNNSNAFKAK